VTGAPGGGHPNVVEPGPGIPSAAHPERPRRAESATGARQALGTVMTKVGSLTLGLTASVVLARALQPAGRGTYHLITTIAGTTIILGHLSVEQAQTTLWAQPRYRLAVAANSLPLGVAVGGFAMIVALVFVALAGSALTLPHLGLVAVALLGVPLGICTLYVTNITVLNARIRTANRAALAGAVLQCGLLIALGLAGRLTVAAVVAIWVLAMAVPCCVLAGAGRLGLRRFDPSVAWNTVTTGLSYHLGLASVHLLLRVDVFILAAQVPTRLVGIYSLAVGVAEMSGFATESVSQVALSRQLRPNDDEAAQVTVRMTRLTVLAGTVSVLALIAVAPIMIPLAYGRSYSGAVPLLLLLAPGVLALGASRPVSAFLLRFHSARFVVVPPLAALAVNVVLNLLLIPGFGAAGCSAASSVGYLTMAALQVRLFVRASGIRARSLLPRGAEVRALTSELRAVCRRSPARLR
jgi:O-antigen/teichoic acid export membrane protein